MLLFYPLSSLIHFPIDHTDLGERTLVYVHMRNRAGHVHLLNRRLQQGWKNVVDSEDSRHV